MPPSIVSIPARAGSMQFSDEDVTAVIDLLGQAATGQAVKLTDAPDEKENTSRRRAEVMKDQITDKLDGVPVKPGFKLRGHVLTAGDPEIRKISGKNYKFFPENWAAVSLVKDTDAGPDTDAPEPDNAPEPDTDAPEPDTDAPEPDTDAPEPDTGSGTPSRRGRRN